MQSLDIRNWTGSVVWDPCPKRGSVPPPPPLGGTRGGEWVSKLTGVCLVRVEDAGVRGRSARSCDTWVRSKVLRVTSSWPKITSTYSVVKAVRKWAPPTPTHLSYAGLRHTAARPVREDRTLALCFYNSEDVSILTGGLRRATLIKIRANCFAITFVTSEGNWQKRRMSYDILKNVKDFQNPFPLSLSFY